MKILIRREEKKDIEKIEKITISAFKNHPFSHQTEHFIINALRKNNALTLSLVVERHDHLIGHLAFSPITISDGAKEWYGLGPISVDPKYQNQGIGTALMKAGLSQLKKLGANGCVLVGDHQFYQRFGFQKSRKLSCQGIPQEYLLILQFYPNVPSGIVTFDKAFLATG